jgi:hypothetical protein
MDKYVHIIIKKERENTYVSKSSVFFRHCFLVVAIASFSNLPKQESNLHLQVRVEELAVSTSLTSDERAQLLLYNVVVIISGGQFYLDGLSYAVMGDSVTYFDDDMMVTIEAPDKNGVVRVNAQYKKKNASTSFTLRPVD